MMRLAAGETKPAAGVMATSPATSPEAKPSMVGLPRPHHSPKTHARAPVAAAMVVVTNARAAVFPAERALPALKPNHPNQRRPAPVMVIGRSCGMKRSLPKPRRLPMKSAQTSALNARGPVHDRAAGEVEDAVGTNPAAVAPHPVGHRVIDERGPQQGEEHVGAELHPLDEGAGDERRGDDGELELEHHEGQLRDAALQPSHHVVEQQVVEAADEAEVVLPEGNGVAEDDPLHRHQRQREVRVHERGEHVLAPHHAAVEERQPRRHEQHQRGGDEKPRRISGVSVDLGGLCPSRDGKECHNDSGPQRTPHRTVHGPPLLH